MLRSARQLPAIVTTVAILTAGASAQSLDERLDEDEFLRGLVELQLPEVLKHYLQTHPPESALDVKLFRLAAARMRAASAGAGAGGGRGERLRAIEETITLRDELLREFPDDPRRALWLADQATDLYLLLLPVDGSALASLFGLPLPEQRDRAQIAARRMNELAAEAELQIEQAILDLESCPGYASNLALQSQRRRLDETERQRRIPFLRGVSAVLEAELNDPGAGERRELHSLAAELLPAVADRLDDALAAQARLHAGIAMARLGRFDEAEELLRQAGTDPASSRADVFAARMGAVINRIERGGPESGLAAVDSIADQYTAPDDLFFRLLIADRRFLLRRSLALKTSGTERAQLLAAAYQPYIDFLRVEEGAHPGVRGIVFARLALAAREDVALERTPGIVAIARAAHLSREQERHDEAIELLRRSLERDNLDAWTRAAAIFELARAQWAAGRTLAAAEGFLKHARVHANEAQAEHSIELAAGLAASLYAESAGDERVRSVLGSSVGLLLERYPNLPSIDRWRFVAGELALADRRFDEAAALFAQIPPDAPQWAEAQVMSAAVATARIEMEAGAAARARADEAVRVIDASQRRLQLRRDQAGTDATDAKEEELNLLQARLEIQRARALLGLSRPEEALRAVQTAEAAAPGNADVIGEALLVKIDAYHAAHRSEDVRRELARLLETSPEQIGRVVPSILQAIHREFDGLLVQGREEEAAAGAQREAAPLARVLQAWLERESGETGDIHQWRLIADSYRLAGECDEALPIYARLLEAHPDAIELLSARGECLFALGDDHLAEAMQPYRRIGSVQEHAGDAHYWQAQLRMLQILDRLDRNTRQIAPQIRRLRQKDPTLGGERFRRQFDALHAKHGR